MSLPDLTKPFTPAQGEIRDNFLTDLRLGMIEAGVSNPALQPGTEPFIRAEALDNAFQAIFGNINLAQNDSSYLTATGDALESIRIAIGLPEVPASPSAGKLTVSISGTGARTFQDGLPFLMSNGKRGRVFGTQFGIVNGGSVNVIATDLGDATNQDPGATVRWFSPPLNVLAEAVVGPDGLTGGADLESDNHKRERISNRYKNLPAAGNWGFVKEIAEGATNAVLAAFVYSALGGPASLKVTVIKSMNVASLEFTRVVPAATVSLVNGTVLGSMPAPMEIAVGTVDDELVDVTIGLSLPDSATFGSATGWNDIAVYPILNALDNDRVTVSHVTNSTTITVTSQAKPVAGQNSLAWWSVATQSFTNSNITSVSGSVGAWVLGLDNPLVGVAVGDYISANAVSGAAYVSTWLTQMNLLGPGENTTDANVLAANRTRGFRRPFTSESFPSSLTVKQLSALVDEHSEIQNADYLHTSQTSPTVPATVALNPRILRLRNFGFYPL